MVKEILHRCEFCEKPFTSEVWYLKHKCKEMIREDKFASLTGQAAWECYKAWMKEKHKGIVSNSVAFKKSKYFNAFYKFIDFTKKTKIPRIQTFINLMVKHGIEPNSWTTSVAYRKYLNYVTRQMSAQDLAGITIDTLFNIAEDAEVNVSEIFEKLTPNDVIQLLHQGRLSPLILLNSKKFAKFIRDKTTSEEKIIMEATINPDYWNTRFKKYPKDITNVKTYIAELGL